MRELTIEELLAPYSMHEFRQQIFSNSALHLTANGLDTLLSWNTVNRLVAFGGLGFPRLRLLRRSQELPEDEYLGTGLSGYPRVRGPGLAAALKRGATLAIESVEELHEPISQIAHGLERCLGTRVLVDLYARCQDGPVPGYRWNDHDTLLLQTEGRSKWQVVSASPAHPTGRGLGGAPVGKPDWEGVLDQGYLLYIPRKWWYREQTKGSSLCLAAKFRTVTASDVVNRIMHRPELQEALDVRCPVADDYASHAVFIRYLKNAVNDAFDSAGMILGALQDTKDLAEPLVRLDLALTGRAISLSQVETHACALLIRFPDRFSPKYSQNEDAVHAVVDGSAIHLGKHQGVLFEALCVSSEPRVLDLLRSCKDHMTEEEGWEALKSLVDAGVVALVRKTGQFTDSFQP